MTEPTVIRLWIAEYSSGEVNVFAAKNEFEALMEAEEVARALPQPVTFKWKASNTTYDMLEPQGGFR